MPSWSTKRQLLYLLVPLILAFAIFGFIYSKYIYHPATCFDGIQNGTETGLDCGGTCTLLCQGTSLAPVVLWSKSFNVTGNVWNAVAYVQNPNTKSSAANVSYEFKLYDANNALIATRDGTINIPRNKTFAVFEGGLNISSQVKRTELSFTKTISWTKDTSVEPDLTITNNPIENASTSPKLQGKITNPNLKTIGPVELVALILDGRGNAIGVSKTVVDPLAKGASAPFVFTWPHSFPAGVDVCQVPSNVMLVLDRSGSMASQSSNPPQPLTSVKNTATEFVGQLKPGDSAGVVSFATFASNPIDKMLTPDLASVKTAIQSITIATSTTDQNTNIGDGLQKAVDELNSSRADTNLKKVIILLTDGIPTDPQNSGQANYPTLYAQNVAANARAQNISIYTIGLGQEVNADILSNIAGASGKFFSAPTTDTLASIYKTIANSICTRKPNVILILSRIL